MRKIAFLVFIAIFGLLYFANALVPRISLVDRFKDCKLVVVVELLNPKPYYQKFDGETFVVNSFKIHKVIYGELKDTVITMKLLNNDEAFEDYCPSFNEKIQYILLLEKYEDSVTYQVKNCHFGKFVLLKNNYIKLKQLVEQAIEISKIDDEEKKINNYTVFDRTERHKKVIPWLIESIVSIIGLDGSQDLTNVIPFYFQKSPNSFNNYSKIYYDKDRDEFLDDFSKAFISDKLRLKLYNFVITNDFSKNFYDLKLFTLVKGIDDKKLYDVLKDHAIKYYQLKGKGKYYDFCDFIKEMQIVYPLRETQEFLDKTHNCSINYWNVRDSLAKDLLNIK